MSPSVTRDAWGVPHVVAGSVGDLVHRQGREVALDRRWQLTWAWLRAHGRTASVVGERGLAWDAFARRMQVVDHGRRAYAALSDETRALLTAYVAGVDEGLADPAPCAELDRLGLEPPRWEPSTPLAVFHAQHLLFATFPGKLWRAHVERTAGPEVAAVLRREGAELEQLHAAGSNVWAVGGELTATGLPLLAGDPHRGFEMPNGYQQVRLTCTDPDDPVDVAGFTFPGVPGVQHFAHAGEVAWGITNAAADYQDVYVERLRRTSGGGVEALGPDGWQPARRWSESVEVAHADGPRTHVVEVVETVRGPVVHGGPESNADDPALSLRVPAQVLGDSGLDALPALLRARTADDVEAAFSGWVEPVNNLVVADRGGVVRHRVVGRIPTRAEANRRRPVPGWEAAHGWTGWEQDLPHTEVAPDAVVVSANDRMTPDYDRVGVEFATTARADRIRALLAGRTGLTVDDMAAVHGDVLAGQPPVLAEAIAALADLPPAAERLRREIVAWDQHLHAGSRTAAAYVAVRGRLVERLADDPRLTGLREHPYGPLVAAWCDLPTELYLGLPGVLSPAGRRLLDVDGALRAALADVAARPPGTWGAHHVLSPVHALGDDLAAIVEPPGLAGDNDCVRCTGSPPGSDRALRGSVARYAWDLAGIGASGWVVPLGAHGDVASPHHHDQLDAWCEARLLPVTGSFISQAVAGGGGHS